jgi:arginyl-tRNA synthetase
VLSALGKIYPKLADKTRHLSHGLVKLPEGKMSSRTGSVVLAETFIKEVTAAVEKRSNQPSSANDNALAAIKYAFLKQNIGGDVVYDVDESINLEGQTGPYIQYAGVRMQSVLDKVKSQAAWEGYGWQTERKLLVLLARYPEVTALAAEEMAPHRIAQFAYELAREFNKYYENVSVKDADDSAKAARLKLLKACRGVLSHSLGLLNIPMPQKM